MTYCPHCGHHLPRMLKDGITSCCNCRAIFDTCRFNQLLGLSWAVRKQHLTDPDFLINNFNATLDEADFVITYVADECYCHEEFVNLLKDSELLRHEKVRLA